MQRLEVRGEFLRGIMGHRRRLVTGWSPFFCEADLSGGKGGSLRRGHWRWVPGNMA